jgi:hypothetical protein
MLAVSNFDLRSFKAQEIFISQRNWLRKSFIVDLKLIKTGTSWKRSIKDQTWSVYPDVLYTIRYRTMSHLQTEW